MLSLENKDVRTQQIFKHRHTDTLPSGHFNVEPTLNQRQTSTLKQRLNMVGFESWMDVEMTTLNQRLLTDVESTSIT